MARHASTATAATPSARQKPLSRAPKDAPLIGPPPSFLHTREQIYAINAILRGMEQRSFAKASSQCAKSSYERRESIVKQSRDITRESKKMIVMLHRLAMDDVGKMCTAAERHQALIVEMFRSIAPLIADGHFYRYSRAISPGIQEFIEAVSLCHFIAHGTLISLQEVQDILGQDVCRITADDYLLGICDLSGELMRYAINVAARADTDKARSVLGFLRGLRSAFYHVSPTGSAREIGKKLVVMDQSIAKVEKACASLSMRKDEYPPHLLKEMLMRNDDETLLIKQISALQQQQQQQQQQQPVRPTRDAAVNTTLQFSVSTTGTNTSASLSAQAAAPVILAPTPTLAHASRYGAARSSIAQSMCASLGDLSAPELALGIEQLHVPAGHSIHRAGHDNEEEDGVFVPFNFGSPTITSNRFDLTTGGSHAASSSRRQHVQSSPQSSVNLGASAEQQQHQHQHREGEETSLESLLLVVNDIVQSHDERSPRLEECSVHSVEQMISRIVRSSNERFLIDEGPLPPDTEHHHHSLLDISFDSAALEQQEQPSFDESVLLRHRRPPDVAEDAYTSSELFEGYSEKFPIAFQPAPPAPAPQSTTSSMEQLVVAATNENQLSEDWGLIMDICDRVERIDNGPRECMVAISKRIPHRNQNVTLFALALTEALTKNCGVRVHREISSRPFSDVLLKKLNERDTHETVKARILALIELCATTFKNDHTLGYIGDVYDRLKQEGRVFPPPTTIGRSNAPGGNVQKGSAEDSKRKEQEDIELAIALSLSEARNNAAKQPQPQQRQEQFVEPARTKVLFRVKGLYDFPGTDRGELPFRTGDIIGVTDCDYQDWWMGELRGQTGLIPSNYVEKISESRVGSISQPSAEADIEAATLAQAANADKLLALLASIDPRRESVSENPTVQSLYNGLVRAQPNAVKMLDIYTQKKDRLLHLSDQFTKARAAYERLMEQSLAQTHLQQPQPVHSYATPYVQQQQQQQQPPFQQPMQAHPQQPPFQHPGPYHTSPPPPQQLGGGYAQPAYTTASPQHQFPAGSPPMQPYAPAPLAQQQQQQPPPQSGYMAHSGPYDGGYAPPQHQQPGAMTPPVQHMATYQNAQ
ncbi:ESCRT-0 subunit protein hse1 [Sorochytrium milnesiophthora]